MTDYDVVIVGGGMVGASLAVALAHTLGDTLSVLVVEGFKPPADSKPDDYQPSFDARATALSYGSQQIYQQLALWDDLSHHATPIKTIHVSDRGRYGSVEMDCEKEALPALGYVVDNRWLGTALLRRIAETSVTMACPARVESVQFTSDAAMIDVCMQTDVPEPEIRQLSTRLLVVADGAQSALREQLGIGQEQQDYAQHAIICNVQSQLPHNGRAFERFTASGPLAFLPTGGPSRPDLNAIVWTQSPPRAAELQALPEQAFLQALQSAFGYRLGKLQKAGQRFAYPLSLVQAKEQARSRVVVVGNAAHSLHPVAGQGYNLALRALMRLIAHLQKANAQGRDIGAADVLQAYYAEQRSDQFETVQFSHLAATLFTSDTLPVALGRDLGLLGLDVLPGLKSLFVRQAAGLK